MGINNEAALMTTNSLLATKLYRYWRQNMLMLILFDDDVFVNNISTCHQHFKIVTKGTKEILNQEIENEG